MSDPTSIVSELLPIIERFRSDRDKSFDTGGRLICPLPWIHPTNTWLHKIMDPAPQEMIDRIEEWVGRAPPAEFRRLLQVSNGLSLFYGSIQIYGVPAELPHDRYQLLLMPFRIDEHTYEWFGVMGEGDFLIGSTGPDVDACIWRSDTGAIDRVSNEKRKVLESWPSLRDWLVLETERFATLYQSNGQLIETAPLMEDKAQPWPHDTLFVAEPSPEDELPPEGLDMSTPFGRFIGTWTQRNMPPQAVTLEELTTVENDLGLRLPTDYVIGTTTFGAPILSTALGESLINSELDGPIEAPDEFFIASEIKEETFAWRRMGLPVSMIAFAGDSVGNLFCFASSTSDVRPDTSQIWFFDHETGETHLVSQSLTAWIEELNAIERVSQ